MELEHFRTLLIDREQNLLNWLETHPEAKGGDVYLAWQLMSQIKGAFERVENQNFGACKVCKGDIEPHRLEIEPTVEICLDCISKQEQEELEYDLFLASKVYRALLPQTAAKIEGFEVAVESVAARIVGGDYYDFLPVRPETNTARVVIADVMGKGIAAGLLMSNVQGALRILAEDLDSPRALISRLNRWLCRNVPVTKFVSLACVALEPREQQESRLVYTNAGHCPLVLVRHNGLVEPLEATGAVLGVHEDFAYEESERFLYPGDLLLLYTDGITEAANQDGDQFGERRLIDFIQPRHAHELDTLLQDLVANVRAFTLTSQFADDYTLVALRKLG